jgi:hypothetical protein
MPSHTRILPNWNRPLDSVGNCLERVDTEDYAFDWDQRLQALNFLVDRKEGLPYDFEFCVPEGPHELSRTDDPRWKHVISLTEDKCGCGQHRLIVGGAKTSELVPDAGLADASPGDPIYLSPRGLSRRQTVVSIEVKDTEVGPVLTFSDRPFTAGINFNDLFNAKGYFLDKLAASIHRSGKKPPMTQGKGAAIWTLFIVEAIDPAKSTVTIRPNVIFSVIRD